MSSPITQKVTTPGALYILHSFPTFFSRVLHVFYIHPSLCLYTCHARAGPLNMNLLCGWGEGREKPSLAPPTNHTCICTQGWLARVRAAADVGGGGVGGLQPPQKLSYDAHVNATRRRLLAVSGPVVYVRYARAICAREVNNVPSASASAPPPARAEISRLQSIKLYIQTT